MTLSWIARRLLELAKGLGELLSEPGLASAIKGWREGKDGQGAGGGGVREMDGGKERVGGRGRDSEGGKGLPEGKGQRRNAPRDVLGIWRCAHKWSQRFFCQ